ncbi:regulatory LuxR family protein [Motilibacter rhizosphaerae]|uniref:Regulatory LuxR family protein n=1 Tax=Motilibacter rhizosphaerae TaxID=598652 RepID=A0A4Q7NVH4_9ACTN|nr:LuxR C-terminal-related transcriptional regulator [Motilibacter rhizosphaerae]RZS91187.1 regulatory LuxR family protein [Motilibacter rhizosphaerae]
MDEPTVMDLVATSSSSGPVAQRAEGMLRSLRQLVPFDAAWLALSDSTSGSYTSLASVDLPASTLRYLSGPRMARDIEVTQTDRLRPPLSPSDLPYSAAELPTWAECLHPSGFHEALAVALFEDGGRRHVGFLALLSAGTEPPRADVRQRLHELTPVLARGIDPVRALAAAARMVKGATAGALLCASSAVLPLSGLEGHPLLTGSSPLVAVARSSVAEGAAYRSFVWPLGGHHAPDGHVRVTVLAGGTDPSPGLVGTVVLSPPGHLRGLTPRELEVLGLVVEGCSNQQIAHTLVVAPRTVATHLEHILEKVGASSRTLAAVRAEREGLYVPAAAGTSARR